LQSRTSSAFGQALGLRKDAPNTQIQRFVFGMILMPLTFIALKWRFWNGPILTGVVMALIFSEVKEFFLMNWGQ
jgi:hypothetical protein